MNAAPVKSEPTQRADYSRPGAISECVGLRAETRRKGSLTSALFGSGDVRAFQLYCPAQSTAEECGQRTTGLCLSNRAVIMTLAAM